MKKILVGVGLFLLLATSPLVPKAFGEARDCSSMQSGQYTPGCKCTSTSQCLTGFICNADPANAGTPDAATRVCIYSSQSNSAFIPQSPAENYIKGSKGGLSTDSQNRLKQKGIAQITTEAMGDLALSDQGGVQSVMGYMTAMYINQPASMQTYIADVRKNMGFPGVKDAYAQGFGFTSIQPVLALWKLARNVALGGFVLVFTVIGIMIMLRSKIDPRTVITIQQAIPRTVIALILVIFSYAIIGLMIDFTSVITRLGASILQSQEFIAAQGGAAGSPQPGSPQQLNTLVKRNVFELFYPMYNMDQLIGTIGDLPNSTNLALNLILKLDKNTINAAGGLTGAVMAIALFVAVIRTFFMLIEAYLKVTLSIIMSPFQFLIFAIPGQGKGFGDWARGILANLLIFPAVFFMLAFAAIFYASGDNGNEVWYANTGATGVNTWSVGALTFKSDTPYWAPPGLGDWGPAVGPLLTLAILLTVPKVGATVRELVNPGAKPGAADGEAAKGIQSAAAKIPVIGSFTRM